MSFDLKETFNDLQERLAWLSKEVEQLQEDNERLLGENRSLREEVTLARLFRDVDAAPEGFGLPAVVPKMAHEFYDGLPEHFSFTDFFHRAGHFGLTVETAKDYLIVFFRENMLTQRGARLEKTAALPHPLRLSSWLAGAKNDH